MSEEAVEANASRVGTPETTLMMVTYECPVGYHRFDLPQEVGNGKHYPGSVPCIYSEHAAFKMEAIAVDARLAVTEKGLG